MNMDFSRSESLNNVPKKKLKIVLDSIDESDVYKRIAINRFAESNIPIEYWFLKMETDFHGDKNLLAKYNDYVSDIKKSYIEGTSICFGGSHGVGKSMTVSCILKKACVKGYSCLYSTLSDIVNVVTLSPDRFEAKRELSLVDFLVIDEFDARFMPTENAADLYARSLEGVFRTRSQNKLPTLMCTNSPNIVESFSGKLKDSIDSLVSGKLEVVPVFGKDYRKIDK